MEANHDVEHRRDSSSTSQPGSGGSAGETEYGEGEIDGFPNHTEYENEKNSPISHFRGNGRGMRSARTSISSLPGSVVVYPHGSTYGNEQYQRGDYRQNLGSPDRYSALDSAFDNNRVRSKKQTTKGRRAYNYAPQVRDMNSPFRHPSSVRALQMGDEDYSDDGGREDGAYFSSPILRNERMNGSPRMSDMSSRSGPMSPSVQTSYHPVKEYALVLLHCTLLPPRFPLSLPAGSPAMSKDQIREILPEPYWTRWKQLEERVGTTGILRDRGILISHPQEAYDLLEERLLETLELARPRLANGHFIGGEDEADIDEHYSDGDENRTEDSGCVRDMCQDCGQRLISNLESTEKKWEVKVYAANGLMGQGAWSAAWKEMEKIDVEVGIWLPSKLKNELEQQLVQEEAIRLNRLAKEDMRMKESHTTKNIPDHSSNLPQPRTDQFDDSSCKSPTNEPAAPGSPIRKSEPRPTSPAPMPHSGDDINLLKALFNYLQMVCQMYRLPILTVLLVLLALITPSPYSLLTQSGDVTSKSDLLVSAQLPMIPVSSSHEAAMSQLPAPNSIKESEIFSPTIQQPPTPSSLQLGPARMASGHLDPSAGSTNTQSDDGIAAQSGFPLCHDASRPQTTTISTLTEPVGYQHEPELHTTAPSHLQPSYSLSFLVEDYSETVPSLASSLNSYPVASPTLSAVPSMSQDEPSSETLPLSLSRLSSTSNAVAAASEVESGSEEIPNTALTLSSPSRSHSPTPTPAEMEAEISSNQMFGKTPHPLAQLQKPPHGAEI